MAELFTAIAIALFVVWGIYISFEVFETYAAQRDSPRKPVSGVESAVGGSATALSDFSTQEAAEPVGRVRFEGEDWNAIFVGNPSELPRTGDRVTIVEVDATNLRVKVQ